MVVAMVGVPPTMPGVVKRKFEMHPTGAVAGGYAERL